MCQSATEFGFGWAGEREAEELGAPKLHCTVATAAHSTLASVQTDQAATAAAVEVAVR